MPTKTRAQKKCSRVGAGGTEAKGRRDSDESDGLLDPAKLPRWVPVADGTLEQHPLGGSEHSANSMPFRCSS